MHVTRALERLEVDGLAVREMRRNSPCWRLWQQLALPHPLGPTPKRDLVRRPLPTGDLEGGDRHGQRVDGGEVQLELAAGPIPNLNRVGDAGGYRCIDLPARWQGVPGETEVLLFPGGWRARLALVAARRR